MTNSRIQGFHQQFPWFWKEKPNPEEIHTFPYKCMKRCIWMVKFKIQYVIHYYTRFWLMPNEVKVSQALHHLTLTSEPSPCLERFDLHILYLLHAPLIWPTFSTSTDIHLSGTRQRQTLTSAASPASSQSSQGRGWWGRWHFPASAVKLPISTWSPLPWVTETRRGGRLVWPCL